MTSTEPGDQVDPLAIKFADLYTDAWGLRGRVADTRNLQVGFQVSPEAYHAMDRLTPEQLAAMSDFLVWDKGALMMCGILTRANANLHVDGDERWLVALVLAPDGT